MAGEPVRAYLESVGLQQYADKIVESGVESLEALVAVDEAALKTIGILVGHRRKLLIQLKKLKQQGSEASAAPGEQPLAPPAAAAGVVPAVEARPVQAPSAAMDMLAQLGASLESRMERMEAGGEFGAPSRLSQEADLLRKLEALKQKQDEEALAPAAVQEERTPVAPVPDLKPKDKPKGPAPAFRSFFVTQKPGVPKPKKGNALLPEKKAVEEETFDDEDLKAAPPGEALPYDVPQDADEGPAVVGGNSASSGSGVGKKLRGQPEDVVNFAVNEQLFHRAVQSASAHSIPAAPFTASSSRADGRATRLAGERSNQGAVDPMDKALGQLEARRRSRSPYRPSAASGSRALYSDRGDPLAYHSRSFDHDEERDRRGHDRGERKRKDEERDRRRKEDTHDRDKERRRERDRDREKGGKHKEKRKDSSSESASKGRKKKKEKEKEKDKEDEKKKESEASSESDDGSPMPAPKARKRANWDIAEAPVAAQSSLMPALTPGAPSRNGPPPGIPGAAAAAVAFTPTADGYAPALCLQTDQALAKYQDVRAADFAKLKALPSGCIPELPGITLERHVLDKLAELRPEERAAITKEFAEYGSVKLIRHPNRWLFGKARNTILARTVGRFPGI